MKQFQVFEMEYTGEAFPANDMTMLPFSTDDSAQYIRICNACFYEMRRALDIRPYSVYSDPRQIIEKQDRIFLLKHHEIIIGSVVCDGTEIDDLIVNPAYQNMGCGAKILRWAVNHIRADTDEPITLHVAAWNQKALQMYLKHGFVIRSQEIITG